MVYASLREAGCGLEVIVRDLRAEYVAGRCRARDRDRRSAGGQRPGLSQMGSGLGWHGRHRAAVKVRFRTVLSDLWVSTAGATLPLQQSLLYYVQLPVVGCEELLYSMLDLFLDRACPFQSDLSSARLAQLVRLPPWALKVPWRVLLGSISISGSENVIKRVESDTPAPPLPATFLGRPFEELPSADPSPV